MTTATTTEINKSIACSLHYKKICAPVNLPALSEMFSRLKSPSILGGNTAKKNVEGFSYWAAEPKEVFEFQAGQKNPFEKLQYALDKYKLYPDPRHKTQDASLPKGIFCGGWIGYFSYELSRYIEKLPEKTLNDLNMPLMRLCFYDRVIAYDHAEDNFWLTALSLPDDTETPNEKLSALERLLNESQNIVVNRPKPADLETIDFSQIRCNMDRDRYFKAIEKIKRYIYDGDVYQINFSQRFECDYNASPIELFHWQNHFNPSPYSAYIDAGGFQIVSASPEMFITIADGAISTKPIKGTRPRINEASADAVNFHELINSEKEQAELNMIIDLERNDMARICEPGTRKVIQPRTIETYPTVFHAVATVAGQLRKEITFCDILKAMFPGGSITGAPKIRSMEIIDETEPTARGIYTGSIGFLGIDGNTCLNIAIRTIIIRDCKAFAQTGGGIVADSDPQAEWAETITKARALLAGINSVQRGADRKIQDLEP
ncbi:MAG: aminodeoxychorismate synthase component I [Phycisphaerae bacterium]|nr:aminodeoxychorismate synthase component I [Phycisphaerae bacterium]MDD5381117.1 aminodeoxychorismate synthase component I [Phycisphaerae bacterium]